ncbi:MAG: Sulfate adenylyltransferase subunit 2 [candidate division WS2 bacterium]|nr:Sulfate adenylyltransferase subunit 2 [Candidatus Psychracetigena formicireducens]
MPKLYLEENVYDAAFERLEFALEEFDNLYFSLSGGKDSSVMLQLAAKVARSLNKKFSILFIDLEAQYTVTIQHVEDLIKNNKDVTNEIYWVCLPISLRNAVSSIQPKWTCWDPEQEEKWVREIPTNSVNIDNCFWDWFQSGMEFEEFILRFAEWYNKQHGGLTGAGIGIRTDESLNRFRTIISDKKTRFKDKGWTTQVKINNKPLNTYNFYPIYDWRTEDIWGAVSKDNLLFNQIYELLYKNGVKISQQRLCQPYGDDQRSSLDQFRVLEPETWEKVLNRVEGVNFGNIYCRTSLLGNIKSEKPASMTWQQYAVFLLESLGLYVPEVRDHYYRKIKKFIEWYEQHGWNRHMIPDYADKKLESQKKLPSWRRIARAIERNDFWMGRLSFGQTKSDVELLHTLKNRYGTNLIKAENTNSKHLKRIAEEMNDDAN